MNMPETGPDAPSMFRQVLGVVAGAVAGTLANALMIAFFLPVSAISLIANPGRYVVALILATALPFLFHRLGAIGGWIAGFLVLTLLSTLLAKLIFSAEGTWSAAFAFNAVYALAAILAYRYTTHGRA